MRAYSRRVWPCQWPRRARGPSEVPLRTSLGPRPRCCSTWLGGFVAVRSAAEAEGATDGSAEGEAREEEPSPRANPDGRAWARRHPWGRARRVVPVPHRGNDGRGQDDPRQSDLLQLRPRWWASAVLDATRRVSRQDAGQPSRPLLFRRSVGREVVPTAEHLHCTREPRQKAAHRGGRPLAP